VLVRTVETRNIYFQEKASSLRGSLFRELVYEASYRLTGGGDDSMKSLDQEPREE
jgi:hypothetical protein